MMHVNNLVTVIGKYAHGEAMKAQKNAFLPNFQLSLAVSSFSTRARANNL
jgi:hypothetical protein